MVKFPRGLKININRRQRKFLRCFQFIYYAFRIVTIFYTCYASKVISTILIIDDLHNLKHNINLFWDNAKKHS